MCMPLNHRKDIKAATTLNEALEQLGEWCSNAKIHTEHIELELRNMSASASVEQDKIMLK